MSTTTEFQHQPIDTGLIRCVCPSTEDDGFTIQCEHCLVWQHAYCVQITQATIPDHYLCDRCIKRKRPKLSKRIPIPKRTLSKLDAADDQVGKGKRKRPNKCRVVSRYVMPIFREARERWSRRWKQHEDMPPIRPLLYDHGPFVAMDATTLLSKGVLMDTPVSNQGLFANRSIPSLRYLMEVTGDVLLKSEFKFDPINDFVILGTPLSHIMFYPTLDLCIDTRQFGNKARYIRRSCQPNAELRNVVLPYSQEDKAIHLGLFARYSIEKGQEVTISWNWQRGHIAWKENMNWHHQYNKHHRHPDELEDDRHRVIDEEEERRRKTNIQTMLDRLEKEFGSCACVNKKKCLIEYLKRQCLPYPKETSAVRSPNIHLSQHKRGRRKSSIILLKPKPVIERIQSIRKEQKDLSRETSDEELLDVEGDIDIGDDLPPLLDHSDKKESTLDNADASSLSSLSSLSVYEDSDKEDSEDASRSNRIRRKKNDPSLSVKKLKTEADIKQDRPSVILPRKKLWVRDYLKKHVMNQTSKEAPQSILKDHIEAEDTVQQEIKSVSTDDALIEKVVKANVTAEEEESHIEILKDDTEILDVDSGELSDASTILLDEDELREAYRSTNVNTSIEKEDKEEKQAEKMIESEDCLSHHPNEEPPT
ncbi:hypothetical protein EDC96DRAFT_148359 [Choanephora cucurbitarum]|nr:hypothetical protein EDC96DRAFT_148359 [Choanephora cucurbitarum]